MEIRWRTCVFFSHGAYPQYTVLIRVFMPFYVNSLSCIAFPQNSECNFLCKSTSILECLIVLHTLYCKKRRENIHSVVSVKICQEPYNKTYLFEAVISGSSLCWTTMGMCHHVGHVYSLWWCHDMGTWSVLLVRCEDKTPVTDIFLSLNASVTILDVFLFCLPGQSAGQTVEQSVIWDAGVHLTSQYYDSNGLSY